MKRIPSVVNALVTDLNDPSGLGRIQLTFPWLPDTPVSAWARVAVPLAGKQHGMYFMPELNDEVLVAFEHGDFRFPYILGYLWNGVDTPPESDPQNRIILTPGSHTLRFEDKNKKIILQSAGQHEIIIDDSGNTLTLQTHGGQSIVLDDQQSSITLFGGGRQIQMAGGQVQIT